MAIVEILGLILLVLFMILFFITGFVAMFGLFLMVIQGVWESVNEMGILELFKKKDNEHHKKRQSLVSSVMCNALDLELTVTQKEKWNGKNNSNKTD